MPEPRVKLIAGILYPTDEWLAWTINELKTFWGEPEIISEAVPFTKTDYYRDIAPYLIRRFVCFGGMHGAGSLADWKLMSGPVEAKSRTPRIINIDPGYIDGARLVLASTKDHAHRVYLRDEIYAEVTMRYRFGRWVSFDYTFPDFASGVYDIFLSDVRKAWLKERAETRNAEQSELSREIQ